MPILVKKSSYEILPDRYYFPYTPKSPDFDVHSPASPAATTFSFPFVSPPPPPSPPLLLAYLPTCHSPSHSPCMIESAYWNWIRSGTISQRWTVRCLITGREVTSPLRSIYGGALSLRHHLILVGKYLPFSTLLFKRMNERTAKWMWVNAGNYDGGGWRMRVDGSLRSYSNLLEVFEGTKSFNRLSKRTKETLCW